MLETDASLVTWRWHEIPSGPLTFQALRLAPHRLAYLDYEGEISGGRGHVERKVSGTYAPAVSPDTDSLIIELDAVQLRGHVKARHLQDDLWEFEFTPT